MHLRGRMTLNYIFGFSLVGIFASVLSATYLLHKAVHACARSANELKQRTVATLERRICLLYPTTNT